MANSVDPDQNAEDCKECRPWSESWEWQNVDPDQTAPENNSVDLDLDHTADNGK